MHEEKIFHWCFIGTGKLAFIVAKQLKKSKDQKIVSCYSRNKKTGKEFEKKFHAHFYSSIEDAISKEGVDAVYIVTPNNTHYRFAKLALSLGKPVLLEKPFTMDSKECEELLSLAREKKLYLCEAMWTWFSFSANKVKQLLSFDALGSLTKASFTYHLNSIRYAERVSDPKRGGGALLDITVYPIAYAYRLFGLPKEIEVKGRLKGGIDLGEEILFHYDGFDVSISASIDDWKGLEKASIKGEKGSLFIPFYHSSSVVFLIKKCFFKAFFKRGQNSYLFEFEKVKNEILSGKLESDFVKQESTLSVMKLLDEIKEKMNLVYPELE